MKWILRAAAGAALLGTALAGGWGCTDDEGNELTLDEYFEQLEELDNEFNERADAAFADVPDDPELSEIETALNEFTGVIDDFVSDIEDLNPPEGAQEAHDAAVEAGNATIAAYNDLADEVSDADSIEDVLSGEVGQAADEAIDQFTTACLDLQQIADDNGIEVGLDCGDEDDSG